MLRRVHIQTDNVGGYFLEPGIVARHVAFQAVGFNPRLAPDPLHRRFAEPERCRQFRQDQCVLPSTGGCVVLRSTRACTAGVTVRGLLP
jgi:hypothetical protein